LGKPMGGTFLNQLHCHFRSKAPLRSVMSFIRGAFVIIVFQGFEDIRPTQPPL
jgi:hypothetical protein